MEISSVNKLKEALLGYLKVKIELLKLDITEHLSKILAQVIAFMIIFIVGMFVLAFASLALANFLNDLWGNSFGGYLVLSAIYIVLLLVVLYLLNSGKLKRFLESNFVEDQKEKSE